MASRHHMGAGTIYNALGRTAENYLINAMEEGYAYAEKRWDLDYLENGLFLVLPEFAEDAAKRVKPHLDDWANAQYTDEYPTKDNVVEPLMWMIASYIAEDHIYALEHNMKKMTEEEIFESIESCLENELLDFLETNKEQILEVLST